jgi:D-xylose reductase
MPTVGLGLWKVATTDAASLVVQAIEAGYRHLDSACDYGNEADVGCGIQEALQRGLCRREDLWITSKLWNTYHRGEHVRPAVERTLKNLQLDYLDLYLVHFPIALAYVPMETRYPPGWFHDPQSNTPAMRPVRVSLQETWRGMEELVRARLVRRIGVCNYGCSLLRDLLTYADIPPAVLQVELHPYLVQQKLVRFCQEAGIAVTGFSPLGAQSYFALNMAEQSESVLANPVILNIASRQRRSPAQIVLRWGLQRGTAVIPKASSPERLRENLALFDFELTAEEMDAISGLDRHRRFNDPGVFCEQAFHTFFPIYE